MAVTRDIIANLLALLWIMLTPFVSACFFLAFSLIAAILFLIRRKCGARKPVLLAAVFFGTYTLFNIYDLIRYRQCGLAISPINQGIYQLFLAPSDLYEPYAIMPLGPSLHEYAVTFRHRYGGSQAIMLNLVNNTPREFDYGNPDIIDLAFNCVVSCPAIGFVKEIGEKLETYYLLAGTNQIELCRYEIDKTKALSHSYDAEIKIEGDIAAFLRQYPGSHLSIRNTTTE